MSDAAVSPAPAAAAQKKAKKPVAKKTANHPKYSEMVKAAIQALKERGGSSRQAILKYIIKNYDLGSDEKAVNSHLKLALKAGVKNNNLKQAKGTGAAGSFRIGEKPAAVKKSPKPKKPVAKKAPKDKTAAKPKKVASPKKKPAAAKKPKSPKKSSPAKKAASKTSKPKTVKKATPKKATGAKKAAAKK